MRIGLGLFRLEDITKETLVFKNIDANELNRRLSKIVDSSTNVGFLTGARKFHGVISQDRFRLKSVRNSSYDYFTVSGEITRKDQETIVEVEYVRGTVMTVLPTVLLMLIIGSVVTLVNDGPFTLNDFPFTGIIFTVMLLLLEYNREVELKKVQRSLYKLYQRGE